ncbi:MAG: response regulator, partial [Lentisphaeraceae bacterium]|nr:response regulator [Lentisphaeraceae bacterium]
MDVKFSGRALIVEDNPVNQMVLKTQLTRMGIAVDVAENGQIALDIIDSNDDYDIIFMDVQMPVMGGVECTQNIRKTNSSIPVIAITANVTAKDKSDCKECGMNSFIPKPLKRDILISE